MILTNYLSKSVKDGPTRIFKCVLCGSPVYKDTSVTVTDGEILSAIPELARSSGVFGEPGEVTGFAGFRKIALAGQNNSGETITVFVTGNGLKDIESTKKSVEQSLSCSPDIEKFTKFIPL